MVASSCCSVLVALALQQSAASAPIPEIIVTGERTPRSLRETPSSVAVVTARDVDAMASPDRIDQVLEMIPNVQMSSGGEGPTIRGQDTTGASRDLYAFLGGNRPRTTLIVDGRPVSFNEFIFGAAPLWDVSRIEVFRSPQTTTQGQNSIAGAIFVVTQDPSATPEYRARAIVGNSHTRQLSAAASGPLADGVAYRVAGDLRLSRPSSIIGENAVGGHPNRDRYGLLRIKLLATPASLPDSKFELAYTHNSSQAPQIEGVSPPFKKRRNPGATYGTFRIGTDSLTASARHQLRSDVVLNALVTAGTSGVERFAPPGLGQVKLANNDIFAEATANWSPAGPLQVIGGVSLSRRKLRQYINLSVLAGEGRFRDEQAATGVFGEATFALLPRTSLTAGLRYQRDAQRRTGALGTRSSSIPLDYAKTFQTWLPKASVIHEFSNDVRAGVLIQRAYNPGGVTLRFDTGQPDFLGAETLWDYEIFARAAVRPGLSLETNLFYYDQRDAQRAQPISIPAPNGQIVTFADLFNIPRARTYGLEASADWRASDRFRARIGVGLLDTKIIKAEPANAGFEGKEFGRAPRFSGTASVEWRPIDPLRISAQARRNSAFWSDDLNTPTRRIDGFTRVDARADWDAGRFRLFGYARNLLDKFYLTYRFNNTLATAGDPREFGVGLEANF
jgi:outer membrane receptor protein involved in Fe transport